MKGLKIGGEMNLAAAIQVAQLALKHRRNNNQQQRITVFIRSTPIFTRDGFFAAAAAPVASISGFEFGVDPNLDHKLALALRVSIKGKKSRQEVAAKKAAEEAAKQEKGGEQSNSLDATMADFTSTLRKLTYWTKKILCCNKPFKCP